MTAIKKRTAKAPVIDIKKYGGRQVVIVGGKIIASGHTLSEVLDRAQRKSPRRPLHEVKIFSVPKTLHVIYRA